MLLIQLWATQEENVVSPSPPKLLPRMNHHYSWRHLLHERCRHLLLGSTMRPTLTPPTPAVRPPPPILEAAVEGDEVILHTGVDCSAYEPS